MHPPSPFALLAGIGMMLVAALAVAGWWWRTKIAFKFFAFGALAWGICVVLKLGLGGPATRAALPFLRAHLPAPWSHVAVYAFLGLLAALVQIVVVWFFVGRTLLREMTAREALGFGIGFGAVEALLLGAYSVFGVVLGLTSYEQIPVATKVQLAALEGPLRIAIPSFERAWSIAGAVTGVLLVVWSVQRSVRWLGAAIVYAVSLVAITTWSVDHFGPHGTNGLLVFEAIGAVYVLAWSLLLVFLSRPPA